jgi:hypothetical protein
MYKEELGVDNDNSHDSDRFIDNDNSHDSNKFIDNNSHLRCVEKLWETQISSVP